MEPRIHVITLGVDDLEQEPRVLSRWTWAADGRRLIGTEFVGDDESPAGAVVMFELEGGLIFALYPRSELAKDAQVTPAASSERSVQHRAHGVEQGRGRRAPSPAQPLPARSRAWASARSALGDLLGLLPRPRRAPLGSHLESPPGRRVTRPELHVLMTGLVFGESPRWHEGRLWFSDWGAQEIIAVDLDGQERGHRSRRRRSRSASTGCPMGAC